MVKVDPKREKIVFGETQHWDEALGGLMRIAGDDALDVDTFEQLLEAGYVDPEGRQNASPKMKELYVFGGDAEVDFDVEVEYVGYMVSPKRSDARIMIDEINIYPAEGEEIPMELRDRFRKEFRRADEYTESESELRAWWD
jgi:hypothetical protein